MNLLFRSQTWGQRTEHQNVSGNASAGNERTVGFNVNNGYTYTLHVVAQNAAGASTRRARFKCQAHVIYPGDVAKDDWVHDLPLLIKETWSRP